MSATSLKCKSSVLVELLLKFLESRLYLLLFRLYDALMGKSFSHAYLIDWKTEAQR